MTRPPDDRDPPTGADEPGEAKPPEDQPTIAWSPPEQPAAPDDSIEPIIPGVPEPTPAPPHETTAPPPVEPTPPTEPAAPQSPIIAADPAPMPDESGWQSAPPPPATVGWQPPASTADASGWQQPAPTQAPGAWPPPEPTSPGPLVGWQTPGPAQPAPAAEGYVIAGAGARVVAYLIDGVLASIVPSLIWLLVFDYQSLVRQVFDEFARQTAAAAAGTTTTTTTTMTIPVTTDFVLLTLIGLAIQYVYFVGFWTSGGQATPGMRGLKMRLVDVGSGKGLTIGQATKRWIALGFPLTLLSLVEPLQSVAGLIQFGVTIFLFFSVIVDDRKQGLHDKFANSLVIRSTTSGDGATVVGCLLLGALAIGLTIIGTALLFAVMGPEIEQLLIDIGTSV